MKGDASYFKLGLFVIFGVVLLIAGVVIFGGGAMFQKYVTVETATTDSVDGLSVGSAVSYRGINVGKVSRIDIATWRHASPDLEKHLQIRRYIILELEIRRETIMARTDLELVQNLNESVAKGLRVRKGSSGLTGPAFVELVFLDPAAYPVAAVPWKPDHMYIPSAPSEMSAIMANIESVVGQLSKVDVGQVVADARKLINDTDTQINNVRTAELRDKVVSAINELRGSNQRLKQILDNPAIDKTIADLPAISGQTRDAVARVNEIVHEQKTQDTLKNLDVTVSNSAQATLEMRRALRKIDALLATQSQDMESIVVNLRRMTEAGAAVVEDAKSNPSRTIFGAPPPRLHPGEGK